MRAAFPAGKGAERPAAAPAELKADLHLHTDEDPFDRIPYDLPDLLRRAGALGFRVLSVTNHIRVAWSDDARRQAADFGILLLPGVELTVEGRHVLLINPPAGTDPRRLRRFRDLAPLRGEPCLLIPAHPFFPGRTHFGRALEAHRELWDAIELSHFYTPWLDFNRRARRAARRLGLPLLGTSDSHSALNLGRTFSLIDGPPTAEGIVEAVKAGRVRSVSRPHSLLGFARVALATIRASGNHPDHDP